MFVAAAAAMLRLSTRCCCRQQMLIDDRGGRTVLLRAAAVFVETVLLWLCRDGFRDTSVAGPYLGVASRFQQARPLAFQSSPTYWQLKLGVQQLVSRCSWRSLVAFKLPLSIIPPWCLKSHPCFSRQARALTVLQIGVCVRSSASSKESIHGSVADRIPRVGRRARHPAGHEVEVSTIGFRQTSDRLLGPRRFSSCCTREIELAAIRGMALESPGNRTGHKVIAHQHKHTGLTRGPVEPP